MAIHIITRICWWGEFLGLHNHLQGMDRNFEFYMINDDSWNKLIFSCSSNSIYSLLCLFVCPTFFEWWLALSVMSLTNHRTEKHETTVQSLYKGCVYLYSFSFLNSTVARSVPMYRGCVYLCSYNFLPHGSGKPSKKLQNFGHCP